MTTLSLAKPIENVGDLNEAKVLAIVDHLAPILDDWRKGEDLRNQLSALEEIQASATRRITALREDHDRLRAEQESAPKTLGNYGRPALGLMLAGAVLLFLVFWLGMVVAVSGLAMGFSSLGKIRKAISEKIAATEGAIAAVDLELTNATQRKAEANAELSGRAGGFPEMRLSHVLLKHEVTEVAGRKVLVDLSGTYDTTLLKAVDVSELQQGLTHISARASELLNVPTLLSAGSKTSEDPLNKLYGEEEELQDLVGEYTLNLGKLRDVNLPLPLIPPESLLARRLSAGDLNVLETDDRILALEGSKMSGEAIRAFIQQVDATRAQGTQVFTELREVFRDLENACQRYAQARTASMNTIHHHLTEVLSRATWCSRRFFCPRTMGSPKYIEDLVGIDPEKAYLKPLDELLEHLNADPEIRRRLDEKPDLSQQLTEAYGGIYDFIEGVLFDEDGNRIDDARRPKHIEDQFREATKRFSQLLRRVMTGASQPVLNFSTEAQMYYDPETGEWGSDIVPYTYRSPDILKYGSVVKTYSDLMVPLWEHLWTEKADFRKSEVFRTNEAMLRMTEKESEKLIEIGNQYRADMRTVRENVYLIESELESKRSEIISFRDGMDMLGLLSDRSKQTITDDKLKDMVLGESVLGKTEHYESYLTALPVSEAESRGSMQDPVELIREPRALVMIGQGTAPRLIRAE